MHLLMHCVVLADGAVTVGGMVMPAMVALHAHACRRRVVSSHVLAAEQHGGSRETLQGNCEHYEACQH